VVALFANDPRRRTKRITRGIIIAGTVLVLCAWAVTAISIIAAWPQALVATVGLNLDEALAPFYRYAAMLDGFIGLATLMMGGLGVYLIREISRRTAREIELAKAHAKLAATHRDLEVDVIQRAELEQQLRESEQRFRDIAEIGGDWIWETGADHRFTRYSGSEDRLLPVGETSTSLIGRTRWEVAGGDPDRDDNWRDYKANIDAHREFRQFRYSIPTRSGRNLFISVNGRPVFDATGAFCGYRGTATDETETAEALHRAERAETLLRDAVDSISEAFVIYDADDRLVMCNQAYRESYWDSTEILKPGLLFEDLLRHGLAQQRYVNAIGREEEWLAARLERHRNPSGPVEAPLSGGRWALISEQRTRNGGCAGLRVDITHLKQTESQLRQAMEHLDRVQRIAGIGSTTMNLVTGHFEWSAGARAIFGIGSGTVEPTVEFFRKFVHPDDRAKVKEAAEHARINKVSPPALEYRIIRPDGAVRVVYRETDVQLDSEGKADRRIATFKDITEFKATEAHLREAMEHLDRVQQIAGIGSTTEDLATGEYTWSPGACAIFGIDSDGVDKTVEFMRQFYHPADRAMVIKAAENARQRGVQAPPLEYRIVRPDGAVRTVYRENEIQYAADGRAIRRIVTFKDITEIKATEARLEQTQEDLNRAQRLAKVGSDVRDLRTGNTTWSDELYAIFGVDPNRFTPTSENLLSFVVPEDRAQLLARRKQVSQGKCPAPTEFSIRRPNGEVRRIYSEAELVRDANGKPIRWVGMNQDITEQARIERNLRDAKEAAEAANSAKSQFLANISHELRTPLNAIIGFSEMLERGIAGPVRPKQREYAGLVLQSGHHLLDIINDILDLAHVDSGKFELREETGVDPRDIIDACIVLMRDRARFENLRLSIEIEDKLPLLVADPTRLKQILLNLLSNAIKFTEPGGSVVVAARQRADDLVEFEVRDSGPGMTPDEIKLALTPFGQVDASHTRRYEGTGLGLPLAQRLAELHGGSLHVNSKKGHGTTVTVTLPAERIMPGR
jgi:PAS domain S-box-containing protein